MNWRVGAALLLLSVATAGAASDSKAYAIRGNFYIGADDTREAGNGTIHALRFYPRLLSASEIAAFGAVSSSWMPFPTESCQDYVLNSTLASRRSSGLDLQVLGAGWRYVTEKIGGVSTRVLQYDDGGYLAVPTASSDADPFYQYTIVVDIRITNAHNSNYLSVLQTDVGATTSDGKLFFGKACSFGRKCGIGIDNSYNGSYSPSEWHRIAIVVDVLTAMRVFVNGLPASTYKFGQHTPPDPTHPINGNFWAKHALLGTITLSFVDGNSVLLNLVDKKYSSTLQFDRNDTAVPMQMTFLNAGCLFAYVPGVVLPSIYQLTNNSNSLSLGAPLPGASNCTIRPKAFDASSALVILAKRGSPPATPPPSPSPAPAPAPPPAPVPPSPPTSCSMLARNCSDGGAASCPGGVPQCACNAGRTAAVCQLCTSNVGCSATDRCNQSPIILNRKVYECRSDLPAYTAYFGAINVTLEYDDVLRTTRVEFWTPGLATQRMYCHLSDCSVNTDTFANLTCTQSKCACINDKWSNTICPLLPLGVGGGAFGCTVRADSSGWALTCTLEQKGLSLYLTDLLCNTGECIGRNATLPQPIDRTAEEREQLLLAVLLPLFLLLTALVGVLIANFIPIKWRPLDLGSFEHGTQPTRIDFVGIAYHIALPGRYLSLLSLDAAAKKLHRGEAAMASVRDDYETAGGASARGGRKIILTRVSGMVEAGQMMAIMGGSGSGKTTLLDILAGWNKSGTVEGTVLVNGSARNRDRFTKISRYVLQEDALPPTLTVQEHLLNCAELHLPRSLPRREKMGLVESVLGELNLLKVRHSRIGGDRIRGISGGERRRVSIASQLVTSPSVLFLDEPTSGLDSTNALTLMACLSQLAKNRSLTIVCSLHQPRSNIFKLLDRLVLVRDGREVYSGPAADAIAHFAKMGFHCPADYAPADFLLDTMSTAPLDHLVAANELETAQNRTEGLSASAVTPLDTMPASTGSKPQDRRPNAPFWLQFYVLTRRAVVEAVRNPLLLGTHLAVCVILGLALGAIFFQQPADLAGFQNRAGIFFFLIALFSFASLSALDLFISERHIFVRERANGDYHPLAYFLSKIVTDIIALRIIFPMLLCVLVYWMVGLLPRYAAYLNFLVLLLGASVTSTAVMMILSSAVSSVSVGNVLGSLLVLFFMLFSGLLLNFSALGPSVSWIRYNYFALAMEGLLANEVHDAPYLFNPTGYPAFSLNGDVLLNQFGFDIERMHTNQAIIAGQFVFCLIVAYIFLHVCVRSRR